MKLFTLATLWLFPLFSFAQGETFTSRVLTTGLSYPWEITMGPDNFLWVTERVSKNVVRVNTTTGVKTLAINISEVYQSVGQDGLMGMALHPKLLVGVDSDFVYVAYTYDADASASVNRKTKIVQLTYNNTTKTLGTPVDVIKDLPASSDHNSGRLKIGPDHKLYFTIGDGGANQFGNKCNTIMAQALPTSAEIAVENWTKYQGKILRLNIDGSIPADNPLLAGVRSHIYSYGHRNAQGLAFAPDGKLYADEHGPKSDDEINLIQAGKNYGWPRVAGFKDDQAYEYGNWSSASNCNTLSYSDYTIPASATIQTEASFTASDFTPPIKTLFTVADNYNFQDPACSGNYSFCWPTIAPSSLDVYTKASGGIPGWANSLFVVSLKKARVYRLKLSADGSLLTTDTIGYFPTTNRYRDMAIGNDGTSFYISTDNTGSTSGPTAGSTSVLANPGAILEYRYSGIILDLKDAILSRGIKTEYAKVYPNPLGDLLNIEIKSGELKPFYVELYDANGIMLLQQKAIKKQLFISLKNYPANIYFLKIVNGIGQVIYSEKIIKQ